MKHFTKILTAFSLTSFLLSQIVVGGNVTDLTTGKQIVGAKVVDMIMKGGNKEQVSIILNESEQGTFNWCMASGGKFSWFGN